MQLVLSNNRITTNLPCFQMLVFKKADSEAKHGNLSGYTVAPMHPLKSIAASTVRFLDRTMSRKPVSVQSAYGGISNYNTVLDSCELRSELDNYLCEPQADLFKTTMQDSESGPRVFWCDPLRYWMACIFFYFATHSSLAYIGC